MQLNNKMMSNFFLQELILKFLLESVCESLLYIRNVHIAGEGCGGEEGLHKQCLSGDFHCIGTIVYISMMV